MVEDKIAVTIIGGGNAGHVMMTMERAGVSASMCSTFGDEAARLRAGCEAAGGVTAKFKDGRPDQIGCPLTISNDLADVIPNADLIIITLPGQFHRPYLCKMKEHLKKGAIMGALPGPGFNITAVEELGEKAKDITIFSGLTLPWACRIIEYAKSVEILGTKSEGDIGVLPQEKGEEVCQILQTVLGLPKMDPITKEFEGSYPVFKPCSIMTPTLFNLNALVHPSILYGAMQDIAWDGKTPFEKKPLFYEGVYDKTEKIMFNTYTEMLKIKEVLISKYPKINLDPCVQIQEFIIKLYPDDISDKSTLQTCFRTNKGYQGLLYPMREVPGGYVPDEASRYFLEDIPTGLLVIKGIGELAGVLTPQIDIVIEWAQALMGKEYLIEGKLGGKDVKDTRSPQAIGITNLNDYMKYFL